MTRQSLARAPRISPDLPTVDAADPSQRAANDSAPAEPMIDVGHAGPAANEDPRRRLDPTPPATGGIEPARRDAALTRTAGAAAAQLAAFRRRRPDVVGHGVRPAHVAGVGG